jgi:hypothetical protein
MHVPAVIAFAFLIALGAGPLRAGTGVGMTTGDLAVQLARAAGIGLPDTGTTRAAMKSLHTMGIDLGSEPAAPATQLDLIEAGRALGVKVTSARADAPVTPAMCNAFIRAYAGEAQSAAAASGVATDDTAHASCQGRESRADREGTPASPADPNASAPPCDPQP